MAHTRTKICGITRVKDALCAAEAGTDAIGLVFCESPRRVDVAQAATIIEQLPPFITIVALFQDNSERAVNEVLQRLPVNLLQFHGNEAPAFCEQFTVPYIKAAPMREGMDIERYAEQYPQAQGVLLDAMKSGEQGGQGKVFDWNTVPEGMSKPLIMAGGLTPQNVADCIKQTHPYAVDVSSGVESAKGIKDAGLIKSFINNVKQTDNEMSKA